MAVPIAAVRVSMMILRKKTEERHDVSTRGMMSNGGHRSPNRSRNLHK